MSALKQLFLFLAVLVGTLLLWWFPLYVTAYMVTGEAAVGLWDESLRRSLLGIWLVPGGGTSLGLAIYILGEARGE